MVTKSFKITQKTVADKKRVQVASDITISLKQHDDLLMQIKTRLDFGNQLRGALVQRMEVIDKELAGYIVLDQDDKKRALDNKRGKAPKPVDVNIQLTDAQIDEGVTYLLSVMAPDTGIYSALAEKDKQETAQGFARVLNEQADTFGHYAAFNKGFRDMYVYNFGGFIVEWVEREGNVIDSANDGKAIFKKEVVATGNELTAFDPYNFIWDVSVPLTKLNRTGEFFATVDMISKFKFIKMSVDFLFDTERAKNSPAAEVTYFKQRPMLRGDDAATGTTNWMNFLSAGDSSETAFGYELVVMYVWLNPKDFGLSDDDELQVWRLHIINGRYIMRADFLNNAHGMLPIGISMPIIDGHGLQTRSFAERLLPLHRFASFQMNVHQRAARKALYGLTIFDAQVIPLQSVDDVTGGQVAAKPTGQDRDLRKSIIFHNDAPDTSRTMDDIGRTNEIAQKILPTDINLQVASLERATQYQAAAVVQGSSRRNHKTAKLINSQCMNDVRSMLMMNVFQFQESMELIDENGNIIEVDPVKFRNTKMEFVISDGLKGTDRLLVVESLKEIIRYILQSQTLTEKVDIMALIDYWADLLGDKTDFNQFAIKTPFDNLPSEQKDMAFKLLQQVAQSAEAGGGAPPA